MLYKNGSSSIEDEVYEVLCNLYMLDGKRIVILVILVLVMFFLLVINGIVFIMYVRFGCFRCIYDKFIINLVVLNIIIVFSVLFYVFLFILLEYVLIKKYFCFLNFMVFCSGIFVLLFVLFGLVLEWLICIVNFWKYCKVNLCYVIVWNVCLFLFGYIYFLFLFFGWNNWDKYGVCIIYVFIDLFRIGVEVLVFCFFVVNLCIYLYFFYIVRG